MTKPPVEPFETFVVQHLCDHHESPKAQRAMEATLRMKKIDIEELERAFAGQ